jgi:hypothetical protein
MTFKERFLSKVRKTATCWLWTAGSNTTGYGYFWIGSKSLKTNRMKQAHRVAYELFCGPIPDGLQLDHICRNRLCVNPDHLEPVTPIENGRRGISSPAINARKMRCIRGHEFSPENTYIQQPQGWRRCKTCHALRREAGQKMISSKGNIRAA